MAFKGAPEKAREYFNSVKDKLVDGLKEIIKKRPLGCKAGVENLNLVYKYIQFVYSSKDMKGKEINAAIGSKVLGISRRSFTYCINTLHDIGLIKVTGKGVWKICSRKVRLSANVFKKACKVMKKYSKTATYKSNGAAFKLANMCFHKGFKKGMPFKRLVAYAAKKATKILEEPFLLTVEALKNALSRYSKEDNFIANLAYCIVKAVTL